MDALKEAWEQLKSQRDVNDLSTKVIEESLQTRSLGLMQTLRRKVRTKFYLCVLMTVLLGAFIPFANPLPSQILLIIMFAAYVVADVLLWKEYQHLGSYTDSTMPIAKTLETFHGKVKRILRYEELIGLMLYPISVTAGFMLGMAAGSENGEYMTEKSDWIALVISIIILVPASDWFARWMNKKAFGKYLNKLEENIAQLKNEPNEKGD